jgi:putative ABC transport system permease protein
MIWEMMMLAQREIRRNVMRSALTITGIVIGVAAVITMVTLGQGATAKVTADIGKMGSNLLHVNPGQGFRGPGGARSNATPFKTADVKAIERQIQGLRAVAPVAMSSTQAIYGHENWSTTVTGSTNAFLEVRDWPLASGRPFSPGEIRAGNMVCLLGLSVQKKLFGSQDPLDAMIRLGKISFKVIGVLASKGRSNFGNDQDDLILVPLSALQRRIIGNFDIASIQVSVGDALDLGKVQKDIERLLRERRRIGDDKEDDFNVMNMQEIVSTLTGTTRVLTGLLGAVAAVSLLVGGIGIMNIMLVSVTERTREIGTRLAIGALEREVMAQFLVEAVVLASCGGICGIALGLTAAVLGAGALSVPFIFKPNIVLIAFAFSATVGIVFGYFPARKAARLDPIQALRHE